MLEVKNLSCGYGSKIVLEDVAFKLTAGEFIGIIGPNGSGKTTLLRAISRLIKPYKGNVFFKGEDIWLKKPQDLAREIAVVSQSAAFSHMTVEEFILLGRIPHRSNLQFMETKKDMNVLQKVMLLTGTLKFRERFLDEMSGGEKQITIIARALAQEPNLLLLDEPTAHLDITHQVGILDLIKKLNKEIGLTVVMVLHDLNLASEYCERLVLINEGRIYKIGHPDEVLNYRAVEEVYKTIVVVGKNPVSSKPYILLVSEEERKKGIHNAERGIDSGLYTGEGIEY